ncbi:MAG: hypothetical protein ABEJ72_04980 [Candidatus Aenigmatarchaeota archaeon]
MSESKELADFFEDKDIDELRKNHTKDEILDKVEQFQKEREREKVEEAYGSKELVKRIADHFGLSRGDYQDSHIHKSGMAKILVESDAELDRI